MTSSIPQLDALFQVSLREFLDLANLLKWRGKERESVSLFSFGPLLKRVRRGTVLFHPTQIGVEVRVPQIPSPRAKKEVCKDLVLWPKPFMTCWNDAGALSNFPICVAEWKVNEGTSCKRDTGWLQIFSSGLANFVGYSICMWAPEDRWHMSVARIRKGIIEPEWLKL